MSDKNIVFLFGIFEINGWNVFYSLHSYTYLYRIHIHSFLYSEFVFFQNELHISAISAYLLTHLLAYLLLVHTFICDYHVQSGNKNNMKRIGMERNEEITSAFVRYSIVVKQLQLDVF